MHEQTDLNLTCPYLGLADDRDTRFAYPEKGHRCFAAGQAAPISLEHQSAYCLTQEHLACPRYFEPVPGTASAPETISSPSGSSIGRLARRTPVWIVLGGVIGLFVVFAILYYSSLIFQPSQVNAPAEPPMPSSTASPSATPSPTQVIVESTSTPVAVAVLEVPTYTPTPESGDRIYSLSPAADHIGWVSSGEDRANHFGDSYLYAGVFNGHVYSGAFQFDLRSLPRGAPIDSASIQLTGLREDRLGQGGTWALRLLAPEIDKDWNRHNYQEIFNAAALQVLAPILGSQDLAAAQVNTFELSPAQLRILETRIVEDKNPMVSFRIDGPLTGPDNLFAWDTGYGYQSEGKKVTLWLSVGPAPATPPPYDYVLVTSTPTPENVLTAAAMILQATADATRIGTATPLPPNMATATPIPDYLVIVPTQTPENQATVQMVAALGTAQALSTGTPTPMSPDAVTATPVPSPTPLPTYVLITATPTAGSVFGAATLSAAATAQARRAGPPTPLPPNWATPLVVTSTPSPANEATSQALAALATAQAFTTGTPTPTPANMVTATPTPIYVLLDGELPPMTPAPASVVMTETIPSELMGKIAFKSNRTGEERIYVINPDGSELALLSDRWPYDLAEQADAYSSDGRFRVFVKDALIDTGTQDSSGQVVAVQLRIPTLFSYDAYYKAEEQVTHFGSGLAYDPAWSPTSERIALVSDDSGNDEIWVINRDGTGALQLTHNTWEWDKHPSWSPDGSKIAFWSNRTGHSQIFVMDGDGGNLYSLSRTGFDDWDPVWIKYPAVPGS
jgi:hypothetical protein